VIRGRRRGRLVRHYFFISVILISGGLITSGLLEIYFRYRENWDQLALLQQEVAAAAAFKIERFVQEIERTMKGATKSRELALRGINPDYKFELERLLLIAPVITEAVALDTKGVIRVQASRLRISSAQARSDFPASAAFQQASQGKSYFGPVYFVRGSEPYMIIAVPIERYAGEVIGVLRAEVNLKYIWEVVSGIKVGKAGYAYVVASSGDLIAHPNISFVLQRRNLAKLYQVHTAFQSIPKTTAQKALVTRNLEGKKVFSSYARIPSLDWAVIIEQPVNEAYGPLYTSILRTSALLLLGFGMALLATLFVARRVVSPLEKLRQGVEHIGKGDLSFPVDLKTGDEIEILADEFNKMTRSLKELYEDLEHKVAERTEALMIANQQLESASAHKSQFLANVSHELRTPLNAIIGFTRLVLRKTEGQIPELQKENLQKVLISSEHLLKLINDLLDLSKIEAGKMEVFPESFEVDEVVHLAASTVEPMLKDGRVRLIEAIASDIPILNTDREKFKQILLNLLSNAAKFTEEGEINISVWNENGFLKLAVSDTGIGIRKEALQHIFEEFRQADMSDKRKYGGTGLGLAIVKRFVTLLKGNISVDSQMGKGSTFTVTLPINLKAVD
jgi:signal transduction histidine kinase